MNRFSVFILIIVIICITAILTWSMRPEPEISTVTVNNYVERQSPCHVNSDIFQIDRYIVDFENTDASRNAIGHLYSYSEGFGFRSQKFVVIPPNSKSSLHMVFSSGRLETSEKLLFVQDGNTLGDSINFMYMSASFEKYSPPVKPSDNYCLVKSFSNRDNRQQGDIKLMLSVFMN